MANWPDFTDEEADAVREVIASGKVNYWTGQEGRKFDVGFAQQWSNLARSAPG